MGRKSEFKHQWKDNATTEDKLAFYRERIEVYARRIEYLETVQRADWIRAHREEAYQLLESAEESKKKTKKRA